MEEAVAKHGRPKIFNTDQGCRFTAIDFTQMLKSNDMAAWTAAGAWRDKDFIERFWRSLKYEEVYLRAYDSASEAKHFIGREASFYNPTETAFVARPPNAERRTPNQV